MPDFLRLVRTSLALVSLVALGAAAAAAQAAADTARFRSLYERIAERATREPTFLESHPLTAAQRASVSWMEGAWRCPGRVFATPTTPARAGRRVDRTRFHLAANGALYSVYADTTPTDTAVYRSRRLFFDWRAGRWVLPLADADGWGIMTSEGWRGGSITFSGRDVIAGSPTDLRQTWTRTSDSTYTIFNEEVAPDGGRVPLDEYACVRDRATPAAR
jgi:hypothetical protein